MARVAHAPDDSCRRADRDNADKHQRNQRDEPALTVGRRAGKTLVDRPKFDTGTGDFLSHLYQFCLGGGRVIARRSGPAAGILRFL